jgi:hypothetical protein
VILNGQEGDDAKKYQEGQVEEAVAAVKIGAPKP